MTAAAAASVKMIVGLEIHFKPRYVLLLHQENQDFTYWHLSVLIAA